MSLETREEARRLIRLIHDEYARLDAHVANFSHDDWLAPSFCTDWRIYQVVSHLGSGPEIQEATLRHALRGGPELEEEVRRAVWARWDALGPGEVHAAYRRSNASYLAFLDSLSDEQLVEPVPWFGGGRVPLARVLAARLNEMSLHAWDVFVMHDPGASLSAANLPDLLEFNVIRLDTLVRTEAAWALRGEKIQFDLSEPTATVGLSLKENLPIGIARGPLPHAGLHVRLSAESFIRLVWGRFRSPATPSPIELSQPDLLRHLIVLFPGR